MEDRDHLLFRIPDSLKDRYRTWLGPAYNGWVDNALFARMSADQQSDPESLLRQADRTVARDHRNFTVRIHIDGRPVWVKQFRPSGPLDRFIYSVRPGKAVYAWNAAMALIENDFRTPRPLIGLRSAGRLGGAAGIAAFEDIAGHGSLREVLTEAPPGSSSRGRVMSELGACLRRFHDLGFRHRDLRQGNILATASDEGWSFWFLDLNRLRIQPPLTRIQRLREVEKLHLPVDGLESFFAAYIPDADSGKLAAEYNHRVEYAERLERLPLGRLLRKAWYYSWELRAFSRARRP